MNGEIFNDVTSDELYPCSWAAIEKVSYTYWLRQAYPTQCLYFDCSAPLVLEPEAK